LLCLRLLCMYVRYIIVFRCSSHPEPEKEIPFSASGQRGRKKKSYNESVVANAGPCNAPNQIAG
jgi:hypothetical protein